MKKIYNEKIVTIFILLQPLLDILINFLRAKFPLISTIRGIFLIYALIYLVFFNKENRKRNYIYLGIMFIYLLLYSLITCSSLNIVVHQVSTLLKYAYFPITLLFMIDFYKSSGAKRFVANAFSISLLMMLAQICGNVILSYESNKLGNSGWFFSANELSAITTAIFPLLYYYFVEKNHRFGFIALIIFMASMLLIGTKTVYLAILLTEFSYIVYLLYSKIAYKQKIKNKLILGISMLIVFLAFTPLYYSYKNIYIQIDYNNQSGVETTKKNIVLNGRDNIFVQLFDKDVTTSEILFGYDKTSVTDNYEFEMDLFTILFTYGVIGIVVFLLPLFYAIYLLIKKRVWIKESINFFAYISLGLVLIVSVLAGHVLLSPAVNIYITLTICILLSNTNDSKNVMFISSVGGHLTQMLELKSLFKKYNYVLITEKNDVTKEMKTKYKMEYLIYGSRQYLLKYLVIFITNIIKSFRLYLKHKPDVIVTTGTHTAVPMCYIGWFFNKKVIFIESFAKRTSPTLSGRLVYPVATTFVVQWDTMLKFYPKAICWGGIY